MRKRLPSSLDIGLGWQELGSPRERGIPQYPDSLVDDNRVADAPILNENSEESKVTNGIELKLTKTSPSASDSMAKDELNTPPTDAHYTHSTCTFAAFPAVLEDSVAAVAWRARGVETTGRSLLFPVRLFLPPVLAAAISHSSSFRNRKEEIATTAKQAGKKVNIHTRMFVFESTHVEASAPRNGGGASSFASTRQTSTTAKLGQREGRQACC